MADAPLSSPVPAHRYPLGLILTMAAATAAVVYFLANPKAAGFPGALFLIGVAITGLIVLALRAVNRDELSRAPLSRRMGIALLDGTQEAVALSGPEGELLYANKAYRRRFGSQAPARALGRGGERDAAAVHRLIRTGLELGRAQSTFAAGGTRAFDVSIEKAVHLETSFIWRFDLTGMKNEPLLLENRSIESAVVEDLDVEPERYDVTAGNPMVPVAARIVEEAPLGIVILNQGGVIAGANQAFRRIAGAENVVGRDLTSLAAATDRVELESRLIECAKGETVFELRFAAPDGSERSTQVFLKQFGGAADQALTLAYVVDTTEQKNLELQFAQSQKMQAVGQLAGGIAHDFNNTLQAIIGFCELLLTHHPAGDPSFADLDQIRQNATRAAGLVRQLLAFSRQQTLMPKVLWLPDAIAENRMLLKRLVGEKVTLDIKHERDLGLVRVDETQLIQVLMNLAVNARDAMPDGGELSIRTANISRSEAAALGHELMRPDEYVLIEVADTGCGIPKELLGKIFEPFFTTKSVGQGTGLGLSTVYGIVKQTNGFVFPESEMGKGTTFRIYLPRHFETRTVQDPELTKEEKAQDHTGRGTILLVEDEDAVRSFAARALSMRGYSVLEAVNGEVALEILRAHKTPIDLVISDVIMPGMDGPALVKTLRVERPELRIILVSGYAQDAFRKELSRDGHDLAFLPKPFSLKQLISLVKEVMAGPLNRPNGDAKRTLH